MGGPVYGDAHNVIGRWTAYGQVNDLNRWSAGHCGDISVDPLSVSARPVSILSFED